MKKIRNVLCAGLIATGLMCGLTSAANAGEQVRHLSVDVNGLNIFYREAGNKEAPVILLLHGFGASSYMFRDLMPKLASKYYVVAPDLPGFGLTTVAPQKNFTYSFDGLAAAIEDFTETMGLESYAIYVFDYGAPVGWRIAVNNPERIIALISQNGNAYEEGLSPGWADMRTAWANPTPENREALRKFSTLEMTKWQYLAGVRQPSLISPESYLLAQAAIERHGVELQLDLLMNYGENIKQYPKVQRFFRDKQPPTLVIWGKNDPFFIPAGAEAFKRDIPGARIVFLDTGHFALETHGSMIAEEMLEFLDGKIRKR